MSNAELTADQSDVAPYPSRIVAWYATILLSVLYWLSVMDRFIISLLVEPIKRDLGITDLQYGTLQGIVFMASFSLFGLVFGALADHRSRRWIIFAGVSIWSLATTACGVAQNFVHLALARVGVGAGEAALNPAATSMLSDLFPPKRLSTAMAVFSMGATLGAGTAFIIGGIIVQLVAQSDTYTLPVIGVVRSWQAVFYIVGIPGALVAFAIFLIREPVRRGARSVGAGHSRFGTYIELLRHMYSQLGFYVCVYVGFGLASAVVAGGGGWYTVHMMRAFGWSGGQVGLYLGITMLAAALIGNTLSGRLMDALFQRGFRDAQMRWYFGCLIIAVPVGVATFTSSNPWFFLGGMALYLILIQPLPVCAYTSMNLATPNNLRGAGVALFAALSGIVAGGLGPILIPAASKYIYGSETAVGLGMATVIAVLCPLAAAVLGYGLKYARRAVEAAEQASTT